MAGHKELVKKLSEDDALRQQILDTPTREGKQAVVRDSGLTVPDHHDVLQEVAGGSEPVHQTVNPAEAAETGAAVLAGAAAAAAAII